MKAVNVFWLIVAYLVVLYTVLSWYKSDDHSHASVIVLKLPRSGSSWFTELLNDIPTFYISKEIVQSSDIGHFSLDEIEHHLARALTTPVGKIQSMNTYSLQWMFMRSSQRYFEDYVFHKTVKWWNVLEAVGFSVNPEHCEGLDWSNVIQNRDSTTKLIVYRRSNIVKSVVSGHFGQLTKAVCGSANIRASSHGACDIPKTLNITLAELVHDLEEYQARFDYLSRTVRQSEGLSTLPTLNVYYEELQSNRDNVLRNIVLFNRRDHSAVKIDSSTSGTAVTDSSSVVVSESSGGSSLTSSLLGGSWVKRSSEDLSEVLVHFKQINESLAAHSECNCFYQQLNERKFKVFKQSCSEMYRVDECFRKLKGV